MPIVYLMFLTLCYDLLQVLKNDNPNNMSPEMLKYKLQ